MLWLTIGEVEITRLQSGQEVPQIESFLEAAADIACSVKEQSPSRWDSELASAICLLPRLPPWARLLVLRLVIIGSCFADCSTCGELLDVEWEAERWLVGGKSVQREELTPSRQEVLATIRQGATERGARALRAIGELAGVVKCPSCESDLDVIELLAGPLKVPS